MKLFKTLTATLAFAAIAQTAIAQENCRMVHIPFGRQIRVCQEPLQCAALYRDAGFSGRRWAVKGSDANMHDDYISRREWHGHLRGWSGSDVTWGDEVSSARIAPGCTLTIYSAVNFGGEKLVYDAPRWDQPYEISQVQFNDSASSWQCECNGGIGVNIDFLL